MTYFDRNRRAAVAAVDDFFATVSPISSLLTPDTAALVRNYAASLQQLVNAEAIAVCYGSARSIICIASSGFSGPQLGSELSTHPAAREAIRQKRTVIFPWSAAESSICAAQSCIAIPAPRGSEISTLLMVYAPSGDTLGESGMRMLEAAAEYLAFIITAAAPAPELGLLEFSQGSAALESSPEDSEIATGFIRAEEHSHGAEPELPYFDAPMDSEPIETAIVENEVLEAGTAWEQFDLLDDVGDAVDKSLGSATNVSSAISPNLTVAHHSKPQKPQLPIRPIATCVLLAVFAGVIFIGHRKATYVGAPLVSASQVAKSTPAELPTTIQSPLASVGPHKVDSPSRRTPPANGPSALRRKALTGDATAHLQLADALAKSDDPALQLEAYALYIVAGEMGNSTAHKRARELNSRIPKNKIGEVRARVAAAFEEPGATHDLPEAYEWYLLAANSGAHVEPQLDRLRQQMTPEGVRLAESAAHDWLERHRVMSEH